jgi:hypothetical protein
MILPPQKTPQSATPSSPGETGGSERDDRRRYGEKTESEQEELLGLRLTSFDEREVVYEQDEAEGPAPVDHGNSGNVNVPAGQRHNPLPGLPARSRVVLGRSDMSAHFPASESQGVVSGPREECQVGRARRRRHDALVARDLSQQALELGPILFSPVRDEGLAGPVDNEFAAEPNVSLEPVSGRPLNRYRSEPGDKRQPDDESSEKPETRTHLVWDSNTLQDDRQASSLFLS